VKGRRIRFDRFMPLAVLARNHEEGRAYAAANPTDAAVTFVATDDPEPMLKMPAKSFAYTIASAPTLAVWAAAVERGVPLGDLK
jgi:hypothetical protein